MPSRLTFNERFQNILSSVTRKELGIHSCDSYDRQQALRNVLETFAHLRGDLGYEQGMNFIAGVLLLHLDEEVLSCPLLTIRMLSG